MTFEQVTDDGYLALLERRLHSDTPLTWLQQARDILAPYLPGMRSIIDVGCATGYAAKVFPELDYLGLDLEEAYLKIARAYFDGNPRVSFRNHDIVAAPTERADTILLNAVLEHCPSLSPALDNLISCAGRMVLMRTWLGEKEQIHTIPSPKAQYAQTVRKCSNQYAFIDIFRTFDKHGFDAVLIRDRYSDSLPYYVDQAVRSFYFVRAVRRAPPAIP
jgi:SAM-dependent methyltransferase